MKEQKNVFLTPSELMFFITGCVFGIGLFSLPNSIVPISKQDAWISTIIGGIYPIYFLAVTNFLAKRYPDKNILSIGKEHLGNIFGNIFNFLFMLESVHILVMVVSGASNLLRVYVATYIPCLKVCSVIILLMAFASYRGIKVLGKLNSIMFFLSMILILSSFSAFKYGSLLNIQPIFGSGISNILKGSIETSFAYSGIETAAVIYCFVKEKDKIGRALMKSIIISIIVYVWVVFVTIIYLGVDIIPKNFWSFVMVTESIQLPIINTFRFIFMFLWSMIIIKTVANYYFVITYIASDITKIDRKKLCVYIIPVIFFLISRIQNEIMRREISGKLTPYVVAFNLFYITLLAILVLIKGKTAKSNKRG